MSKFVTKEFVVVRKVFCKVSHRAIEKIVFQAFFFGRQKIEVGMGLKGFLFEFCYKIQVELQGNLE